MYLDATPPLDDSTRASSLGAPLARLAAVLADPGAADRTSPGSPPAARELSAVLRHLRDHVPGTSAASLLARNPAHRDLPARAPATVAATGDLARAADRLQLAAGCGPCLEGRDAPVHAGPQELRERWPELAEQLGGLGVRAVLAQPLPGLPGRGVLALYAHRPFPVDALTPAAHAAAVSAVALAALETHERAANLEIALSTSRQIAAAIGIVMAQQRCSYDEAFQRIRAVSQRTHRKMSELADDILFTGSLPDAGGPPGASG